MTSSDFGDGFGVIKIGAYKGFSGGSAVVRWFCCGQVVLMWSGGSDVTTIFVV